MPNASKEWAEIKSGTRIIRDACGRMLPTKRGIECLAKVQDFESEINRIVKRRR